MGFEMIFQGFQPSDEQIEDLEQGNPINDAEHVRDAEQQRQQHLQQQQWQQDAVTRTLWYCTQHGSDHSGEEKEHIGEDNEEYKEENGDEQKLSPDTQEQSHASDGADSLSSTDANDPKTDAAEVPQEGTDHPDHPTTISAVTEGPQDAATNSAAADSAPTANEPNSAAEDPMEEEVDTIHTSDYSIYNLMASHILFPMPNNPTYQPIYQALQDYIPDMEQREQALQLLQEIAIVMFSEAGDLQSNVQSTVATLFLLLINRPTNNFCKQWHPTLKSHKNILVLSLEVEVIETEMIMKMVDGTWTQRMKTQRMKQTVIQTSKQTSRRAWQSRKRGVSCASGTTKLGIVTPSPLNFSLHS
jgi:hypothetical protein